MLDRVTPDETATLPVLAIAPTTWIDHPPPTYSTTTTSTTLPPPTTTTTSTASTYQAASVSNSDWSVDWDYLADCESGDRVKNADGSVTIIRGTARWGLSAGNGYYGGLQFSARTWKDAGGIVYAASANEATREQQISVAESWLRRTSLAQWPDCTKTLGWR